MVNNIPFTVLRCFIVPSERKLYFLNRHVRNKVHRYQVVGLYSALLTVIILSTSINVIMFEKSRNGKIHC